MTLTRRSALSALAVAATAAPALAQPKPFTMDVILALTGPAAALGGDEAAGFAAYEKLANANGGINGQPIHFEIHDDGSNPATAVSLLGPILSRKPVVVFGSTLAGPTQAMAALVKNGPVLYAQTPNVVPEANGYVFAAGCAAKWYGASALRYYGARGVTKIATIATSDASGQNNLSSLDASLAIPEYKNVTVLDRESFALTDISMTSQAARIKAAAPQVIFGYPNGTEFGTALHGLSDVGLDLPVYTSAANFNPILLERFRSFLPTELTSTAFSFFNRERSKRDPLRGVIEEFYTSLATVGVAAPTVAHMFAWDPARIVVTALRALGTQASPEALRDAILKLRHFAGAAGYYDFSSGDQHGLSQEALLVIKWDPKTTPGRSVVVSAQGGAPLRR